MLTDALPRAELAHTPTPLETLNNLTRDLQGPTLWVKRDDCTGLAMGGNKARQLEFYIGDALAQGADTLLTTGAVQSNHVRMTVAAARKLDLAVEVQLEQRVSDRPPEYYQSGNPFLLQLMGARIHHYPVGEDEEGADAAMHQRAEALRAEGKKPYVIPLSSDQTPYGALGYVRCAEELYRQLQGLGVRMDALILPSGSAATHAGMLVGLRALGESVPVYGFCVRREQTAQATRVLKKARAVEDLMQLPQRVRAEDVLTDDHMLWPGYGQLNEATSAALALAAQREGLLLDPTYSAKAMAGLLAMVRAGEWQSGQNVVFLHTGGSPALFGYPELVAAP